MESKNYIVSQKDLLVIADKTIMGTNQEKLFWVKGFRVAEEALIPVIDKLSKENKELSNMKMGLLDKDLLERIETLDNIIKNKEELIRDGRGMVNTSYQVVCEKNLLLADCREMLMKISQWHEFDGLVGLIERLG